MKVKCIRNAYLVTKDKIYDVNLDIDLNAYIINDAGDEYIIEGHGHIFEVIHCGKEIPQKTLRDEFAMAAIQGILTTMAAPMGNIDVSHHEYISAGAYSIADAMMKVRNENEQTKE